MNKEKIKFFGKITWVSEKGDTVKFHIEGIRFYGPPCEEEKVIIPKILRLSDLDRRDVLFQPSISKRIHSHDEPLKLIKTVIVESIGTGKGPILCRSNQIGGASGFRELYIEDDIAIKPFAFGFLPIQKVRLPKDMINIPTRCFFGCENLKDVNWEELITLRKISAEAFEDCHHLENVSLPKTLCAVGKSAFKGSGLKHLTFKGTKLSSVSSESFALCKDLASVDLTGVGFVAKAAFNGCASLNSVKLDYCLSYIGKRSFSGTAIESADLTLCSIFESKKDIEEAFPKTCALKLPYYAF